MKTATPSLESRLRLAAILLMSLPALVATACFAHGHGAVSSNALLVMLVAAIATGACGAYPLFKLLHTPQRKPDGLTNAANPSTP